MLKIYPTPSVSLLHSLPCPRLIFLSLPLVDFHASIFTFFSAVQGFGFPRFHGPKQHMCTHACKTDNFEVPSSFCLI